MKTYKTEIHEAVSDSGLSYSIKYAEITADSKAEAMRMAAQSVDNFKRCIVVQTVDADPDAIEGVQWLLNNREV